MTTNVLNRFEQPVGGSIDNKLILGGTVVTDDAGASVKSKIVSVPIGNVSAAGSVWVVPGVAGTILKISNVIDAAITAAAAGLTFKIGGVAVTDSAISIAVTGSAAGVVDQSTPSDLNVISTSEAIEVVKDGSSTGTSLGVVTFEIEMS